MKKMITILSIVLTSSVALAASEECETRFESLMTRQYEMSRLETSALNRLIKGDDKNAKNLQQEADRQKLQIEERKEAFLNKCII